MKRDTTECDRYGQVGTVGRFSATDFCDGTFSLSSFGRVYFSSVPHGANRLISVEYRTTKTKRSDIHTDSGQPIHKCLRQQKPWLPGEACQARMRNTKASRQRLQVDGKWCDAHRNVMLELGFSSGLPKLCFRRLSLPWWMCRMTGMTISNPTIL